MSTLAGAGDSLSANVLTLPPKAAESTKSFRGDPSMLGAPTMSRKVRFVGYAVVLGSTAGAVSVTSLRRRMRAALYSGPPVVALDEARLSASCSVRHTLAAQVSEPCITSTRIVLLKAAASCVAVQEPSLGSDAAALATVVALFTSFER